MNVPKEIAVSFRNAPMAWALALAAAALPFAVLALKGSFGNPESALAPAQTARPERVASASGGVSEWFSGADNPFLTEEQARERRQRAATARVEEVLRRRPDVREVTILASAAQDGRPASAVVSISMREGVVPVPLVDAAGTLLSAAVPGLRSEDVTVVDESTGIRARAQALGAPGADDGRKALELAQAQPPVRASRESVQVAKPVEAVSSAWPWWIWGGGLSAAVLLAASIWAWRTRGLLPEAIDTEPAEEDAIQGTLAMALHRGVAEQGALIATALVERLEQGAPANEVAQLLLGLEPWAAERLLKSMPPEALAKVEEALRDPAHDAPEASVRALAEAVLSVRAAA